MATATINKPATIERLVARKARLADSLTRAQGERRDALQAELDAIKAQIADIKAALEAAGE